MLRILRACLCFASVASAFVVRPAVRKTSTCPLTALPSSLLASEASMLSFASTWDADLVAGLDPTTTIAVFVVGLIPFVVATIEFWRRIAFGESFGTGTDSVVIGQDGNRASSRGRRILGKDALVTAGVLFAAAAGVLGVVVYAVVTSEPPPPPTTF